MWCVATPEFQAVTRWIFKPSPVCSLRSLSTETNLVWPIGPFVLNCLAFEDGIYCLSQKIGTNYQSTLRKTPEKRRPVRVGRFTSLVTRNRSVSCCESSVSEENLINFKPWILSYDQRNEWRPSFIPWLVTESWDCLALEDGSDRLHRNFNK